MKKETLEYALFILNTQREHLNNNDNFITDTGKFAQQAYYQGLRTMLDIIVSEAYTDEHYVDYGSDGIHHIKRKQVDNREIEENLEQSQVAV